MKKTILFSVILLLPVMAAASEVMTSARQIGLGRVSTVAYYVRNEQTVDFGSRGEYDLKADAVIAKVSAKVWDGWHVFVKAGKIGADFEKGQDKYTSDKDYSANLIGLGIKYNLFPDTIVTPGISIDLSAQKYSVDLDKYNKVTDIDNTIESLEFQGVLYISKKFFAFEPAVGLKILRNNVKWKDNNPAKEDRKIEGSTTGVSPFVCLRFNFLPLIGITVEASALAEKSFAAGLTVGF